MNQKSFSPTPVKTPACHPKPYKEPYPEPYIETIWGDKTPSPVKTPPSPNGKRNDFDLDSPQQLEGTACIIGQNALTGCIDVQRSTMQIEGTSTKDLQGRDKDMHDIVCFQSHLKNP